MIYSQVIAVAFDQIPDFNHGLFLLCYQTDFSISICAEAENCLKTFLRSIFLFSHLSVVSVRQA